jgi:hypothetical protein
LRFVDVNLEIFNDWCQFFYYSNYYCHPILFGKRFLIFQCSAILVPRVVFTRSLGEIKLWVRRQKGEIWFASQRSVISQKLNNFCWQNYAIDICQHKYFVLCNNSLWKLLRVLKRPKWKACALKSTAIFFYFRFPVSQRLRRTRAPKILEDEDCVKAVRLCSFHS